MRYFLCLCSLVASVVFAHDGSAAPSAGPNGNFYEYIAEPGILWEEAQQASQTSTFLGASGHLATVLSSEENNFIFSLLDNVAGSVWLGGSDAGEEGVWRWVTGEIFWIGGPNGTVGPDVVYANWRVQYEPNDLSPGEDYLTIFGGTAVLPSLWNDISPETITVGSYGIAGYVIEYDIAMDLIGPPTLSLVVTGFCIIFQKRRQKRAGIS